MGNCINLLANYPKSKRDIKKRLADKTEEDRVIARKFDKEFFDGDRKHGYGGFNYNPIYWEDVIPDIVRYYNLKKNSKILDIGCAKGFMLYDFKRLYPDMSYEGIDISSYAIENSIESIKPFLKVANATKLPFSDNYFDLTISINTLHNLEGNDLDLAFKELNRVTKINSFITVDAFENEQERELMLAWNLTAKTILSVKDWQSYFKKVRYNGDYYWFKP